MSHLVVNLPAIRKSLRKLKNAATDLQSEKKVTSAERTRKYRERIKNDSAKLERMKEIKKEQNHQYKEQIKQKRKANPALDEQLKAKQREWKRNSRKRQAVKEQRENAQKVKSTIPKSSKKQKQASIRKNAERVNKYLPRSPRRWVKTMTHLMKNASPRKQMQMNTKFETEVETSTIEEVLDIQRVGRPSKQTENVKRKLEFASSNKSGKKRWNNTRYKKRKHAQEKRKMTKPNAYKARWQETLLSFLENHSRIMPNKKDTLLIQGKPVAKRHLLCSKRELFGLFKKENQGFSRKFTTFISMIPKNYKCLNLACRRVCVCLKDYNLEQQVNALNKKAQEKSIKDITKCTPRELSDLSVCPFDKTPARACIDRECENCGVATVQNLYAPLIECCSETETVKFSLWEKNTETYTTRKGEVKTSIRWIQSEKNEKVSQVVDGVCKKIDTFTAHIFRADYQHQVETEIMSNLPLDQCIVVMDFSENISLQPQDEIESSHWTHKQVTLHPIYIVRHAPESTEEIPVIVKESLIILSDHLTHDTDAVFAYTEQLLIHLQNNPGPEPVKVLHRFSDNCASQYKCKRAFEHLLIIEEKYNIEIVYHYTESGHGKGPSDGLGAGIKKRIERLILGGKLINNAYQAYLALVQKETEKKNQLIIYVPSKRIRASVPQIRQSKTIPGTQSFHMIRQWRRGTGILICADLSCSCQVCITEEEGPCLFAQYRQPDQFFGLSDGKRVPRQNLAISICPALATCASTNTITAEEFSNRDSQVLHEILETHAEEVARHNRILREFESNIAVKGLQIRGSTPEDGNCFFWSISDQLDLTMGSNMTHTELRQRVVEHIHNLSEEAKAELSGFLSTDILTYSADISRDGTYADHVCVSIMSKELSVTIQVVHSEDPDVFQGIGSTVLVIGYLPELQHYVSLEPIRKYKSDDFVAVSLASRRGKTFLYVAKILRIDGDIQLRFLQRTGSPGVYTWPQDEDLSWQSPDDIIMKLSTPILLPGRGLKMKFNVDELKLAEQYLKHKE